ncbi:unnamed protein product [Closterium sp. NIES-53]
MPVLFLGASKVPTGGTGGDGPVGASAVVPRVGGIGGAGTGGATGGTGVGGASLQESLSLQQLCEWAVRWGSPGGGAGGACSGDAVEPVEVTGDSGAAAGAEPRGAETGGAETGGAEPGGVETGGAEPRGAEPGGAELGGAEPGGTASGSAAPAASVPGGSPDRFSRREPLSPLELREWFARRWRRAAGAGGAVGAGGSVAAEGAGTTGHGGARTEGAGAAGPGGASGAGAAAGAGAEATTVGPTEGTSAAAGGTGVGATTGAGSASGGVGAVPAVSGGAARPRPYFVPLLQQVLGLPPSPGPSPLVECPQPVPSQSQLQPASPLPSPFPYAGPTGGLAERREPASRPASPVRAARPSGRGSRQRPPPVPGTHQMSLRPSTAPLRAPLPSPPQSSLPTLAGPESDSRRDASPTVTRLLASLVTDPSFESAAASALVAELVDFAAACRLDYAASLVAASAESAASASAASASACPPSVGGDCALGTDVLEDRQEEFQCFAAALPHLVSMLLAPEGDPDALDIPTPRSYAEAMAGPYSSQWQSAMDAEMASWKSTGTYVDAVPPPGANIVSGMWIFRVKRPPGSPPVFKARYVARGFSQRQGVDFFQTFSPTPKMTTLRVLLHVAAQRDYELHSLDFSTAFLQGRLHEEIWLRRPPGFTGSFPPGTQWSLRRPVYGLRQAPREWHDTLRTTLAALGFAPSTADPSLFLRTNTSLPPFYILVYVDDLVFATADTAALAHVKSELQKRHTCTDLGELTSYLGLRITRDRARRTITLTQSHMVQQVLQRFGFTYSSPQSTPLPTGHSLSALPSDESVESSGPYPELVGCLMYLMTCTRPDLAYPLSILTRYVAPGRHRKEHMDAAKRVLRYLCSTSGMGLVLGGRERPVLTGHSDASWADDQATQRSSQGYTFSLGSGSVSWRSTRSSSVLSSSCEAEIYATAMAAQELRWLTYLLTDLGERPRSPPVLYVDNKATIALCQEHRLEHRTKHIALRYFLARELQQRGQLRLRFVATEANTADVFTKALPPRDHQRFCTLLGLSQPQLLPGSSLLAPAPHTEVIESLTKRREPETCASTPVRGRRVVRPRAPAVPGTHRMALRPSSVPQRVVLPSPLASSLPHVPDPESDLIRTASPTVTRLLATVVTDPSFESAATSALVTGLVDFAALCRLDYFELECLAVAAPHLASTLLCPEGEPDALDIPTPPIYTEAITDPYSSQWQIAMDAEMASWKVKWPPGTPPAFKACYVARGFSQREGVDFFQTFSPTPKMTTLWVLLHIAAQRDYELHSLDFSKAFLQGSLYEAIWLRRPRGFTGSFSKGTKWSLRRPVYGLRQAPREWHDTLRTTLAALGFAPSTADLLLFLRTDTSLPPFYVLVYVDDLVFATADTKALTLAKAELHERYTCIDLGELRSYLGLQITWDRARRTNTLTQSHMVQQVLQRFEFSWSSPQPTPLSTNNLLSAPPSDESVEPSGPYPELVGCFMYLMTCTRPDLAYPLNFLERYVAPSRHRKGSVVITGHSDASWADDQSTHRSTQGCEAEIYAGAMAAQELRCLTYLLIDLGERPRSPLVLYIHNKAMIALCQVQSLQNKTKHISLRYFLTRELQQRGQLRLTDVATQANTADVFTKALGCSDHQPLLSFVLLLDWSSDLPLCLLSPTLPMGDRSVRVHQPYVLPQELLPSCAALLAVRCPARRALPCPALPCALPACCPALQPVRRPALQPARCPALQPASPCPAARASLCPAARTSPCPAARASPCPTACAPSCPAARASPCSAARALPCRAACTSPCPAARASPYRAAHASPCPAARASLCPAARALPCRAACASPCPAARASPCPAARVPPCPVDRALPCPAARASPCLAACALPCPAARALPCHYSDYR